MENQETIVETQVEEKDWKAEAERLAQQVSNLNKAVHEARSKKPADVEALIEEKLQGIEQKRMADDIEETAKQFAGNDEERAKILEVYKNDLKPSGFSLAAIKRDMEKAALLANKDKVLSEAEKKARKALAEKSAMQNSSVNMTSAPVDEDEPALSEAERRMIEQIKPYIK